MDFAGVKSGTKDKLRINNMYKGTKHYVHKDNGPTPGLNWIKQWYTLFEQNPHINFYKVNQYNDGRDAINSPISEWENNKKLPNVHYLSHSTLDNMLKGWYIIQNVRWFYIQISWLVIGQDWKN